MFRLYHETSTGERWYYRRDDGTVWEGNEQQMVTLWRSLLSQQQILEVERVDA